MNIVVSYYVSVAATLRIGKQLLEIVPETRDPMSCRIADLLVDDRRVALVADVFKHANVQERNSLSGREVERSLLGYYEVSRLRRFTPSELASAEYLWFIGSSLSSFLGTHRRDADGVLVVDGIRLPPPAKLYESLEPVITDSWFVPEIEAQGFAGMAFRSTRMAVRTKELDESGKPMLRMVQGRRDRQFAEIFPSVELPAMVAAEIVWVPNYPGQVLGPAGPGAIRNPGFDDFQPVFTRSALQSVGPFDIARTLEFRSEHQPEDRMYIISQRFYRFLQLHEIEATCVPVKIIEE